MWVTRNRARRNQFLLQKLIASAVLLTYFVFSFQYALDINGISSLKMMVVWTGSLTGCCAQGSSSLVLWREFIRMLWKPFICKSWLLLICDFQQKDLESRGQ